MENKWKFDDRYSSLPLSHASMSLYKCWTCGAAVADRDLHHDWHNQQLEVQQELRRGISEGFGEEL